jgi:ABC-type Na+ efflux pump permease subunit
MPVLFGLAAGTITKFGMAFERGMLTTRAVISQISMLALLALLVETPADMITAAPSMRALAAAGAALLGARLVDRFERYADAQTAKRLGQTEEVIQP